MVTGMDPKRIREDFPIFSRKIGDKPLIYFDNGATSQRPRQVIEAIKEFYEQHNANIHRGLHTLSQEASELYEEAHERVAKFIGAESGEEVIFVRNTSEALNLVAYSLGPAIVDRGDEIVISIMEHHSNLLPWYRLAMLKGAKLKVVDITDDYRLNYAMLEEIVSERTKIVAIVHMSNVLGTINDVRKIAKLAHEHDAVIVVDGAQSVPHMPVNVKDLDIDFLAFSGHKMLGPTGIGVLYGKKELLESMDPFLSGGDMIKEVSCSLNGSCSVVWNRLPWKFEAGTPNIAGGIGLMAAVEYLERIGMGNIRRYEEELTEYALRRMNEELGDHCDIYGPMDIKERGGIISFNIKGIDPHEIALYLDSHGIAVRSGFHCAQPLHERLGLRKGSARASFYLYNLKEEIDVFVNALKELIKSVG